MNQISSALAAAGVKIPSAKRRVWNHVKSHPGVSAKRLSQELKLPVASVSAYCSTMVGENRMEARDVKMRIAMPGGKVAHRHIKHYYATCSDYDNPHPRVKLPEPAVETPQTPARAQKLSPAEAVETLTVSQAREIWEILNRMFGSEK